MSADMTRPFHMLVKPNGPICNLGCAYCYYLEKTELYPQTRSFRMSDETLEEFIRQYIEASPHPIIDFAWQGGEPTLLGIDFFRRVVELQKRYAPPTKEIRNAIQTNGTLLDDDWCRFLKENSFLVGLSMDGPRELHDRYRLDKGGNPTHERVLEGLRRLQDHEVDYNVLCVVNELNSRHPEAVYDFFVGHNVDFIQFIPLVEPQGDGVSPRSVTAEAYGEFLVRTFDHWIRRDVGRIFLQIVEETLAAWSGGHQSLCVFQPTCGKAFALEHNGDLYCCDHFVLPEWRLGNLHQTPLAELTALPKARQFGLYKREKLPAYCRNCDYLFVCNGGCPKNRLIKTPDGEEGLNYLCAGYKRFFAHVAPFMKRMVELLRRRMPPALIMGELHSVETRRFASVKRNDPCPCGSGLKYKKCCLSKNGGR
ncbi:MAG: anaerobic sulfatase maturase [Firmicutes bacterium]|jgi:uncharacterized protein|nr:anaerobic sulfatase maturase [Bacillota bacterium]